MSCTRHPDGNGPAWCQDCHGVHMLERPAPVVVPTLRDGGGGYSPAPRAVATLPEPEEWDPLELELVRFVGRRRHEEGISKPSASNVYGLEGDIGGAGSEYLVARLTRRFWWALFKWLDRIPADVGSDYQVRWAPEHGKRLIVRPDDPPEHVYWFVTGTFPALVIRGAIRGVEARLIGWWGTPNERELAWWVRADQLQPPEAWAW